MLAALDAPPDFPIAGRTLREVLTDGVALSPAPDMLFQLISYLTGGERKQKARRLAAGEDPDGDGGALDVLAALHKFPGIRPDPEAFIEALDPLQPRVYSISSSLKSNPGRVSLTVDAVRYEVDKRTRLGVCSTFLGGRIAPGGRLRVYVQNGARIPDAVAGSGQPTRQCDDRLSSSGAWHLLAQRLATTISSKNQPATDSWA